MLTIVVAIRLGRSAVSWSNFSVRVLVLYVHAVGMVRTARAPLPFLQKLFGAKSNVRVRVSHPLVF